MQTAGEVHYQAALDVLGHLVKTKHLGITFGGKLAVPLGLTEFPDGFVTNRGLHTYADSSWSRPRPFARYAVMYLNGAINYTARTLKIVENSSCEAKTASASKASKETVAARLVLKDLSCGVTGPTPLLIDKKAARDVILKPGASARTRYFERATMLVKRPYMVLVISPFLIETRLMVADIMTKATNAVTFYRMRDWLPNVRTYANASSYKHVDGTVLRGRAGRLSWVKLVDSLS